MSTSNMLAPVILFTSGLAGLAYTVPKLLANPDVNKAIHSEGMLRFGAILAVGAVVVPAGAFLSDIVESKTGWNSQPPADSPRRAAQRVRDEAYYRGR